MITFPLTLPADGGPSRVSFRDNNTAGVTVAPFSLSEQIQEFDGQAWEMDMIFPPMGRDRGEAWVAALRALRGPVGTFFFSVPGYRGRGYLTDADNAVLVQVDGGGQSGLFLDFKTSLTETMARAFRAGDCFSLGTGTGIHLHTVLEDITTDGDGKATMVIWPRLRTSPEDGAVMESVSPAGLFRLVNKGIDFDRDEAGNVLIAPTPIREAF